MSSVAEQMQRGRQIAAAASLIKRRDAEMRARKAAEESMSWLEAQAAFGAQYWQEMVKRAGSIARAAQFAGTSVSCALDTCRRLGVLSPNPRGKRPGAPKMTPEQIAAARRYAARRSRRNKSNAQQHRSDSHPC